MKTKLFFALILLIPFSGKAQTLYFPSTTEDKWDQTSPQDLHWCQNKIDSLYDYLNTNNTKSFILLKDGKIVLEKYFGSHLQTSSWYWASAGKSLTAFLIGIAQQEKFLSITDTTSHRIGQGWSHCTSSQEEKITIKHQLSMTTGLNDGVADHFCTLDTCLVYKSDAGARWAYHNGPYTLLDSVIEKATNLKLNAFAAKKLLNPIGMTGIFKRVDYNNVFFSTGRSMARYGLLILNKGNWNGTQILKDNNYFNEMTHPSQSFNNAYGYLWWLNGGSSYMIPGTQYQFTGSLNPHAPDDMIAALGKNGQFINVVPSQNLVWIRMGDAPDNSDVPFLFNDKIWEYLNSFECVPLSVNEDNFDTNFISIFPNPTKNSFTVKSKKLISQIDILNIHGNIIKIINTEATDLSISIDDIGSGVYFIKVKSKDGETIMKKIIKE